MGLRKAWPTLAFFPGGSTNAAARRYRRARKRHRVASSLSVVRRACRALRSVSRLIRKGEAMTPSPTRPRVRYARIGDACRCVGFGDRRRSTISHPLDRAAFLKRRSGLVATGLPTTLSMGMSEPLSE